MHETWFSRDLPVLEAVVRRRDANPHELTDYHHLAEETGLPAEDVARALAALDGEYLEAEAEHVKTVYSSARRAVGAWPTPENFTERLLVELRAQAAAEPDPTRRGRLQRLADAAQEVGVKVIAEVVAKLASNAAG
jgi:hypothetical protein